MQFLTLRQDTWDLFTSHIFVDEISEYFPIINIDSANVLLISCYLSQKVARNNENNYNKENYENLQLVVLLLEHPGKRDTNSEAAFSIWITVLQEVIASLLICHNGVGLGDLYELIYSFGIVWILVWMFFPGQFSISFLDNTWTSILLNTKNFVGNKSF